MGFISASRSISGTDLVGCVTTLDTVVSRCCQARVPGRPSIRVTRPRLTFLEPQVAFLPSFNPPPRGWVYRLAPEHLFLGECRRSLRHFWECQACLGYGPESGPTLKKALCQTPPFGGACDKCRWFNKLINIRTDLTSFDFTAFWPAPISCKFSC